MERVKTSGIVVRDYIIGESNKRGRERIQNTPLAITAFALGAFATFRLFSRDGFRPNLRSTVLSLCFGAVVIDFILPISLSYLLKREGRFPATYWNITRPLLRGMLTLCLYFAFREALICLKSRQIGRALLPLAAASVGSLSMAVPFSVYWKRGGVRDNS